MASACTASVTQRSFKVDPVDPQAQFLKQINILLKSAVNFEVYLLAGVNYSLLSILDGISQQVNGLLSYILLLS